MESRVAVKSDAAAICEIYNQGILEGNATFETRFREIEDIIQWFGGENHIVVTCDRKKVIAFAASFVYSNRECYSGVAEFSVYVHNDHRGKGVGRSVMNALFSELRNQGYWKIVSRVFPENLGSRALLGKLGFREVGIYKRHGRMNGKFRDVIIVEFMLR